jgi:DNA segregation ATPase FtsK/SpoIIIE-like protein
MVDPENRVRIFVSYAHEDDDLRRDLRAHLSALDYVDVWDDREIGAGTKWNDEIEAEVDAADIILLLISKDFIASSYVKDVEIKKALERHRAKTSRVIPVLLRHCLWKKLEIRELQAFPPDEKWVTSSIWDSQDAAFLSVVNGIERVAQDLFEERRRLLDEQKTAEETYRKKVAEMLADDDRISLIERDTLEELRTDLELSQKEAERIEAGELQPIEEKRQNLAKYQKTLEQTIERKGLPFDKAVERDLEKRRAHLGLTAEDAEGVEKQIIDKWQAEREAEEEDELKAKQEAEQKANQEADREAKQEAERKAKQEAQQKAKQEAQQKAKQEAQQKAKQETERKAKQEAQQKAKQEAEREAKQEAERKAQQEAEQKAKAGPETVETPSEPEPQKPRPKFCRQCGEKTIPGTKFCRRCGTGIST